MQGNCSPESVTFSYLKPLPTPTPSPTPTPTPTPTPRSTATPTPTSRIAEQFRGVYQLHQLHNLADKDVEKRMLDLVSRMTGPSRHASELYAQIKAQAQVDF